MTVNIYSDAQSNHISVNRITNWHQYVLYFARLKIKRGLVMSSEINKCVVQQIEHVHWRIHTEYFVNKWYSVVAYNSKVVSVHRILSTVFGGCLFTVIN